MFYSTTVLVDGYYDNHLHWKNQTLTDYIARQSESVQYGKWIIRFETKLMICPLTLYETIIT